MSRPTMSRWGRSAYDTDEAWAAEATALRPLVSMLPPSQDAEVVVVNSKTLVGRGFLGAAPSVRLVITSTSGYEHLDLPAIHAHGAQAARLPLVRRDAVVEASLELLIAGLRQTRRLHADAMAGRWSRARLPELPIRTLRGSTVGVVGLGVIGRAMAHVLSSLGATVVGSDPAGLPPGIPAWPLEEMMKRCDAVTLHAASSTSSRGMVGAALFALGHPGLVMVNTARGDLLDLDAAFSAVSSGTIGFLGVDVFPEEPWKRLSEHARHPAVVFTPHSAGWHAGLPDAVRTGLETCLKAWRAGAPLPHRLV